MWDDILDTIGTICLILCVIGVIIWVGTMAAILIVGLTCTWYDVRLERLAIWFVIISPVATVIFGIAGGGIKSYLAGG